MNLIVKGVPIPKPARMTRGPLWSRPKQEQQYRAWQDGIRLQTNGKIDRSLPSMAVTMKFYLPVRRLARRGWRHTVKPDLDNLVKGVLDALFKNDSSVWLVQAEKYYDDGNGPRLELQIT